MQEKNKDVAIETRPYLASNPFVINKTFQGDLAVDSSSRISVIVE